MQRIYLKMEELVLQLKTISEKELNNETLTDDEYELIRSYGGQIEHFWLDINEEDMKKKGLAEDSYLSANPSAWFRISPRIRTAQCRKKPPGMLLIYM